MQLCNGLDLFGKPKPYFPSKTEEEKSDFQPDQEDDPAHLTWPRGQQCWPRKKPALRPDVKSAQQILLGTLRSR